jgi:hypothetical protein
LRELRIFSLQEFKVVSQSKLDLEKHTERFMEYLTREMLKVVRLFMTTFSTVEAVEAELDT